MPLLTDVGIRDAIGKHDEDPLVIHPILDPRQIFGTKVELRMDNELYRFKQGGSTPFMSLDKEIVLNEFADRIIVPYGSNLVLHRGVNGDLFL